MITNDNEDEYYDSEAEPSLLPYIIEPQSYSTQLKTFDLNESISQTTPMRTIRAIYAVQFINKQKNVEPNCCRIFINQENAMKLCKQEPDNRRFKMFKSFKEAYAFSYESSEIESGQVPTISQIQASITASLKNSNTLSPSLMQNESKTPTQDAEKLPFSGPKKIEINELRPFIEKNNLNAFRTRVLSNPRFLISAGDSPVIIQESFRYNCLHICAKENRFEICEFLLNTLSSVSFIQKLYINDSLEQSRARSLHLLDLYMNMPEKGLNETALHFACKFGALEVTRLILSYDICSRNALNKFGKTPEDLICSKTNKQNYEAIKSLFEDCFYLPLYRDEEKGNVIIEKPCAKLSTELDESTLRTSAYLNMQLNKSQHKLAAYVGPISPTNANAIYERLKSPARLRQSPSNLDILRSDDFKGYERIVRKMTDEMNMPWTEYWWFLDSFCDFKKHEGLSKLEIYLEQKKLQIAFDFQVQSSHNILKENNEFNDKLIEVLQIIENLKKTLDLKENQLSLKYENFLRSVKSSLTQNTQLPLMLTADKDSTQEDFNNEKIINEILTQYMTTIIELSKLDKTTKCYFNLYKTSKNVLELLSCQKLFEQFYLSPVFNQKIVLSQKKNDKTMNSQLNKKDQRKSLLSKKTNKIRLNKGLFNENEETYSPRTTLHYSSSDEEENDEEKEDYQDEDEDLTEIINSSFLANQNLNNLNMLVSQMSLKSEETDKNESKENVDVYKDTPLRKTMDSYLYNNNNANSNFKLFMFGDTPSKLDRAVYLAIQDIKIDLKYYPILNEWFSYMRKCDQNEMIQWKSPMKKTPLKVKFLNH